MDEVGTPLGSRLKHVQVREYVRQLIAGLPEGAPAPSERGLMQHFGVARMTVRQAIDALVAEGLLERAPARGTFVCKSPRPVARPLSFAEDARARGWAVTTETLQSGLGQAGPGVAKALGITVGDPVVHWRRRRRHDDVPLCYQDVYLNETLLPGFLHGELPESLYSLLATRGLRPRAAEDQFSADLANAAEAEILELKVGDAILRHSRRGLVGDMVIEVSRSVYAGSRYTWWSPLAVSP
ncbi:MAG TPA: GntR family transcriptional regulator [Nocardioides sp.]|uniref:GntR family transcriptional regulator n=1 Tax=Nocardioides sp. TaxID=35761 RepID=UPI002E320AD9|nr:GntR family transcriptional regulator [Nocardioides sp.]HEX3929971.1 GntR family transcriptional regulator [Nocardioides sp.]